MKLDHIFTKRHVIVGLISLGLIAVIVILCLIAAFQIDDSPARNTPDDIQENVLRINNTEIEIERAVSAQQRTLGLSNRDFLEENKGLLFIFDSDDTHGIWMKDMNFAIDVVWFNQDKEVVTVINNIEPESYPEVFQPDTNARFILELNANKASELGISVGDQAQFRVE